MICICQYQDRIDLLVKWYLSKREFFIRHLNDSLITLSDIISSKFKFKFAHHRICMNSNVDTGKPTGCAFRRHDVQLSVEDISSKKQLQSVLSIFLSRQDSWNEKVFCSLTDTYSLLLNPLIKYRKSSEEMKMKLGKVKQRWIWDSNKLIIPKKYQV